MHYPSLQPVETDSKPVTLIELLRSRSLGGPTLTAYRFLADAEESSITYGELDRRARAVAAVLQSKGWQRERALLLYPPGIEFIVAFFGCLYAGMVAVPSSLPQTKRGFARLQTIADDAQPACVLTTRQVLPRIQRDSSLRDVACLATDDVADGGWRETAVNGDALAYLQYTSGSTSTPRGVMVTHANVLANSAYIQHGFEHGPQSVSLSWLPHFHDMGLVDGIIQPLYSGFTGLLMSPAALLQNPASWLQAITRYRVTHSGGPNFAYDLCARRVSETQIASLDLSTWSVAYNGAEPVRHETIERFVARFASRGFRRQAFYPAYGLAEATLKVTGGRRREEPVYHTVERAALERHRVVPSQFGAPDSVTLVGCGHAALGTEIAIVDPESSLACAADEVGEIWVSGPGVAAGYWNRPDETERTFEARVAGRGRGFLRTGDLGFVRDGELFVTGRLKDLIIIRGRNHYPQDIEAAVQHSHTSLKPDGGAAFSLELDGEERLAVVHEIDAGRAGEANEIVAAIREAVAEEFEIQPAAVVLIRSGTLPRTSSGKVRRGACRDGFVGGSLKVIASWRASRVDEEVTPPAPGELSEESVAEWLGLLLKQRLNIESLDVAQPIARYGIDSLVSLELVHAIETNLGVKLSPASFLRSPTIAELTGTILAQRADREDRPALDGDVDYAGQLSHGQQALWSLHHVSPESTAYNVFTAVRFAGDVDLDALRRAFDALVQRHPLLRVRFPERRGVPVCVVREPPEIAFRIEDATDWTEDALHERLEAEAWTTFDLENGPLLKAIVFKRSTREHVMLLSAHHIIVDFWSLAVLLRELGQLYEGAPAALDRPTPYAEFVRRQAEMLAGPEGEGLRDYWRRQFARPLSVLDLPADRVRPRVQTYRGASVSARLDERLTKRLKQLGAAHEATLFVTMLAAFEVLLYRYTGQDEILVGSPSSGRSSAEFASTIGYFVNPLVLRAKVSGERSFSEFLAETRLVALAALEHQNYPFDLLVKQLQPERDPARSPLFQVMFAFEKNHIDWRLGSVKMETVPLEQRAAQFDLSLAVKEIGSALETSFEYNTDLFDASTVERLSEHFQVLLESVVTDPSVSLSEVRLLSDETRRQIVYDWNDTHVDSASLICVHEQFARRAAAAPDQIAVVEGAEALTYGELDKRANRLAHYLRERGVGPESRVGICVPRSTTMLTCVLAVLKAGGAYVPLDPSYPEERLAYMIENSGASLLLTSELLETDRPAIDAQSDAALPTASTAENLAYIIYTSGSTGTPKGVMVQHGSLTSFISAANAAYGIVPADRILQFSSFSVDVSVEEIFMCLTSAATLVLRDGETPKAPADFLEECRDNKLTVMDLPSAYWHELVAHLTREDWATMHDLRLIIIGGDKVLPERVERWRKEVGSRVRLMDTYGPTEATVVATMCDLERSLSIGRPMANTQAYVLDQQLQPVMVGARGELYLGGANISRGYLGEPVLTAQKFLPNPFSLVPGARLYRTGDLARYRHDGEIEFLGRVDQQLKVRGHRIEPGEIEAVLLRHEAVKEAIVVAREAEGERRLAAYVVGDTSATELRRFVSERLPKHMIPASFTMVQSLPRLPSGKIDRRALPAPAPDVAAGTNVAPRTAVERVLCEVWADVLKLERVGIHDNFFELGGDSILSIQVAARARLRGVKVSPSQVFEHPTPLDLAAVAIARTSDETHDRITGDVPLTPIQRWFFEQEFRGHWNMAVMLEARERLDARVLEQAFAHLVQHHDALRLRFVNEPAGWRQFMPAVEQTPRVLSISDDALETIADETQAQIDLGSGVLLRVVLFENGERQRLLIAIHHLVVDGLSWRVLLEDLGRVYRQLQRGEHVSFPPRTTSYAHWASLLTEHARSEEVHGELDYWSELSARPVKPLPIDLANGKNVEGETRTVTVALDAGDTRALVRSRHIDDVLLTALLDTISHWTGEQSVLIELERHGREDLFDDVDLSRTVGWFTSAFPMLLESKPGVSLSAKLRAVKQQLRAVPRHGIGYGLLRYLNDHSEAARQMRRVPAPEISFNYLGQLDQMLDDSTLFSLTRESCGRTRHDSARRTQLIEINAHVSNQQLRVDWTYSTGIHLPRTIEDLAEHFVGTLHALVAGARADEDAYPLSPLQQGMLFHSVYTPGSTVYVGQLSFMLRGNLDVNAFIDAWRRAVARHSILRSSFIWADVAEPFQRVSRDAEAAVETLDWRELSPLEQETRVNALLEDDRRRGFDPAVAPLMRLKLVRLADESHRFIWTHHHLLLDGWSTALLLEEVFADYGGVDRVRTPRREYRDYIAWLGEQDFARAKSFWQTYLDGFLAPTPLVVDHAPADPNRDPDTQRSRVRLSQPETEHLHAFAREQQLTLSTLVQGAWALLLSRYSRETDVLYGATVAGRPAGFDGIESMIGLFINTLPVRIRVQSDLPVVTWLKQIQANAIASREYEQSPLVELQALSSVPRGEQLFESLLVFENYPLDVRAFGDGMNIKAGDVWWFDQTNYPLTVVATPGPELSLEILYDAHRFTGDVIQRMLDHLQTILAGLAADPARPIAQIRLVTEREQSALLTHGKHVSLSSECVHQLCEQQARQTPDRIAVACGAQQLTYAELNARANRLARYLVRNGVETESRVCICLEPGIELIVAVFGVLKAGAAYVPLDPTYPDSRLSFMLEDCGARVLLTESRLLEQRTAPDAVRVVCIDGEREEIMRESPEDTDANVSAGNLFYAIYTSGSTGRPKAASVMHGGFANLVNWFISDFGLTAEERVLIISSFSFDLTQKNLFAPLITGGELHFPRSTIYDPAEIVDVIAENRITLLNCTPSAFYPLLDAAGTGFQKLSTLKHVFLGGEPINVSRLSEWTARCDAAVVNTYGPTEATDVCSSFRLIDNSSTNTPPIGKPIDNVELLILDDDSNLVPQGVAGELCIGGIGVGRGYLNNPCVTAEHFIPHPFSNISGARLYRTGDLVRLLPDGNIEFLNRLDHQVKVSGYRIEAGEVETLLSQHPDVKECVVAVRTDAHGNARLVAYVVPARDTHAPDASALRSFLTDALPAHMVPSVFVALEKLPLTPGGKVDRRALPAPDPLAQRTGREYVAPRTPVEQVLAGIWCDVLAV
ncbi:MAG TPA: amino acid adenylation domain-containing protein, partial [Pyrinomonadaceae bacterium]|nr:amino acid adenylation domain-containing protein [Pyrinomonadaceae bacterium]